MLEHSHLKTCSEARIPTLTLPWPTGWCARARYDRVASRLRINSKVGNCRIFAASLPAFGRAHLSRVEPSVNHRSLDTLASSHKQAKSLECHLCTFVQQHWRGRYYHGFQLTFRMRAVPSTGAADPLRTCLCLKSVLRSCCCCRAGASGICIFFQLRSGLVAPRRLLIGYSGKPSWTVAWDWRSVLACATCCRMGFNNNMVSNSYTAASLLVAMLSSSRASFAGFDSYFFLFSSLNFLSIVAGFFFLFFFFSCAFPAVRSCA